MVIQQILRRPLLTSVILHTFILLALIVSFELSSETPVVDNSKAGDVIKAVVIDDPLMQPITPPPEPIPTPVVKPTPTPKVEQKPQVPPKPPKVIPVEKPKPVEKAIALEKPKKIQKPQPNLIEQQLLADIQKEAVVDKKAKPKPKQITKQTDKQKALEREFEKTLKEQAAKSLQQQLASETKKLAGARSQQLQGVVDKYKALILQAISRRWLIPANVNKNLASELLIRVAPGGDVLDVIVTKSSGDVALDRSARDAVFKSSPLPVPTDVDGFEQFRQFKLKVKPQNLFSGDILIN